MKTDNNLNLVTGATGFVGSHMVELLINQGQRVRATDIPSADCSYINSLGVNFIPSDLKDKKSLATAVKGVNRIFHPAAIYDFSVSYDALHEINVQGVTNLCEVAVEQKVDRFIYWSSASIYGFAEEIPSKETTPARPTNDYEKSKWEGEKEALRFYREHQLPVTVIRPAAIYGPRSKYGDALALFKLARKEFPGIPGNGKVIGCHVHVEDVVRAALFLADRSDTIGEVYNVADDTPLSVEETLVMCAAEIGVKLSRIHIPGWLLKLSARWYNFLSKITHKPPKIEPDMVGYFLYDHQIDTSKLKNLGFQLKWPDTREGLKQTIRWYKQHQWI